MDRIFLYRGNVVREAVSEEAAKSLETKGFVRVGASAAGRETPGAEALEEAVSALKTQLAMAAEAIAAAEEERQESENRAREAEEKRAEATGEAEALREELAGTQKRLEAAERETKSLALELDGTREQLEAAVRKNKAASGKEKKQEAADD